MLLRVLALTSAAVAAVAAQRPVAPVDGGPPWERVRAVLEARCLQCHGGEEVRGQMRFATGETFRKGGSRGLAFLADDPAASRVLSVISYENPDLAMPPTGKLPDADRELLTEWILAGAPWPDGAAGRLADPDRFPDAPEVDFEKLLDWWSYQPLADSPPPSVLDEAWAAGTVDRFLLARMEAAGLSPAPVASADVLLRRASFGITGLPPMPNERANFLATIESRGFSVAWELEVDRLLASPHYGEHWARRWLDLMRYAETNGYERDGTKTNMWRYRDWVIRAFNDDLAYDEFMLEQLAGDEFAEFGAESIASIDFDRAALATGWYRLGTWDDEPSDPEQARADELADIVDTAGQVFLGATMGCVRCHDHKADPIRIEEYYGLTAYFNNLQGYGGGGFGQHLGGGATQLVADAGGAGQLSSRERDRRVVKIDAEIDRLVHLAVGLPPVQRGDVLVADARSVPVEWRYSSAEAPEGWHRAGFDDTSWALGRAGFGTMGTPGARIGTEWKSKLLRVRTRFSLTEIPASLILSLHHDEDAMVYLNGVEVLTREGYRSDYADVQLDGRALDALVVGSNVLAAEVRQSGGGQYLDLGLRSGWLDVRTDSDAGRIFLGRHAEESLAEDLAPVFRERMADRDRLLAFPIREAYPAQVAFERPGPSPDQSVLLRGSVHAQGETVLPTVPRAFLAGGTVAPPLLPVAGDDSSSSGRRYALGVWLGRGGAHMTARVMANRVWQGHFGRGLAPTPGDFGRLGDPPTHPMLLDHLATKLLQSGWSIKNLHREILLSNAYQMSSVREPESRDSDPRNQLLSSYPVRRLTAEEYRDSVLAASGALNRSLYGPSVFPPLSEEVLATASRPGAAWGSSPPEEAARRSIYVFTKRSLRVPLLAAFDQPDPDLPCPERFPTNVPTQALMTLNGDFTGQEAMHLAERVIAESGDLERQIARAIELVFGRDADPDEVRRHREFYEMLQSEAGLDDAHALQVLCLGLYNQNEFLWVD